MSGLRVCLFYHAPSNYIGVSSNFVLFNKRVKCKSEVAIQVSTKVQERVYSSSTKGVDSKQEGLVCQHALAQPP